MNEGMRFFNREELEHFVVMKKSEGWSVRRLARFLKKSRNTIKKILKKVKKQREEGHDNLSHLQKTPRRSKLDAHMPTIKELLERFPDITGQRLFEEIVEQGYDGGITILRDRLRKIRPKPKKRPHVRFETEPGRQGQMDWSPYKINFKRTGMCQVQCFSYILGFSRRQYAEFTERRNFYTLIRRHQDAFTHFRGVPKECLYDNEKTVVLRWEAGQPLFNPAFIGFITHYGCRPIACRPRTPWWKGKVEEVFLYLEKNFLNAREFEDLEDLKAGLRWWLENRSDTHKHNTTKRPPVELFMEEEAHCLTPLPPQPYDASEVGFRVGRLDGFILWDTTLYSMPYDYVTDILTVKASEDEITIYGPDLRPIAAHERLPIGANGKIELSEHRHSKKIRYGLEPVRESFMALGNHAEAFLQGLRQKFPRNAGFHARKILICKEQYHCEDIHKALSHAIRYSAFDSRSIERILKARYQERTLEQVIKKETAKQLRQALPKIEQRSLEEYQSLLKLDSCQRR